jgi:hypothetical protein
LMSLDFLLDRFDELPPRARWPGGSRPRARDSRSVGCRAQVRRTGGDTRAASGQRVFVVIAATPADAERWLADLRTLRDGGVVLFPRGRASAPKSRTSRSRASRIETVEALLSGAARIVVTTVEPVPSAPVFGGSPGAASSWPQPGRIRERRSHRWHCGLARWDTRGPDGHRSRAIQCARRHSGRVRYGMAAPTRIEWWGDEIVSLRAFDWTRSAPGSRCRGRVLPCRTEIDAGAAAETASLQRNPPGSASLNALLVLDQEAASSAKVDRAWTDAAHHLEVAQRMGGSATARAVRRSTWWRQLVAGSRLVPGTPAGTSDSRSCRRAVDRDLKRLRQVVCERAHDRDPVRQRGPARAAGGVARRARGDARGRRDRRGLPARVCGAHRPRGVPARVACSMHGATAAPSPPRRRCRWESSSSTSSMASGSFAV